MDWLFESNDGTLLLTKATGDAAGSGDLLVARIRIDDGDEAPQCAWLTEDEARRLGRALLSVSGEVDDA